ncbi:MAG: FAD-dependent oxidoreductase [Halofilum sp. (in: g-proteobacteria)]|nr:FAD-dependent oxidoreductase [Halofilum sp. (in: g-proteobacteria)]
MASSPAQRIAVVGAGVSGLVAAYLLGRRHDVTLLEADTRPGGHTHTVEVDDPAGPLAVDTGFIVFNPVHYPLFTRLLEQLGIDSQPTDMSFSVRDEASGLEWAGSPSLDTVFGQRRNLLRPRFWGMLRDIVRFGREARAVLDDPHEARSVRRFAAERGYGEAFTEHYLLPLGASLWSCPERRFADFPVRFVVEFLAHHDMLELGARPPWRTVAGGSRRYVDAILGRLPGDVLLDTPVRSLRRHDDRVEVTTDAGRGDYDQVVLALHADDALALLGDDAGSAERELLGAFPYERNEALLHWDPAVLPRRRRCWAAWNHLRPAGERERVAVTYNMNILQRLRAQRTWCVTLNDTGTVDPARIVRRIEYAHPLFTPARARAQARHAELIRHRRTSYCGAYWGYGFHEDGVRSAVAVARAFGEDL